MLNIILVTIGVCVGLLNAYHSWQRARKLAFLFDTCVQNPVSRFVWRYDAVIGWSMFAVSEVAFASYLWSHS